MLISCAELFAPNFLDFLVTDALVFSYQYLNPSSLSSNLHCPPVSLHITLLPFAHSHFARLLHLSFSHVSKFCSKCLCFYSYCHQTRTLLVLLQQTTDDTGQAQSLDLRLFFFFFNHPQHQGFFLCSSCQFLKSNKIIYMEVFCHLPRNTELIKIINPCFSV